MTGIPTFFGLKKRNPFFSFNWHTAAKVNASVKQPAFCVLNDCCKGKRCILLTGNVANWVTVYFFCASIFIHYACKKEWNMQLNTST